MTQKIKNVEKKNVEKNVVFWSGVLERRQKRLNGLTSHINYMKECREKLIVEIEGVTVKIEGLKSE